MKIKNIQKKIILNRIKELEKAYKYATDITDKKLVKVYKLGNGIPEKVSILKKYLDKLPIDGSLFEFLIASSEGDASICLDLDKTSK